MTLLIEAMVEIIIFVVLTYLEVSLGAYFYSEVEMYSVDTATHPGKPG